MSRFDVPGACGPSARSTAMRRVWRSAHLFGSFLGYGAAIPATIAEMMRFSRLFLSIPPYMDPTDCVYLRGAQEEMWQKLLQLQFCHRAAEDLTWMLDRGVAATLEAYGGSAAEGFDLAEKGVVALAGWTGSLRDAMRAAPGHEGMMYALKRAAISQAGGTLFVSSGIDVSRALAAQTDSFWWAGRSFAFIRESYEGFRRIVRGYDPDHGGLRETEVTVTVDGGCGFGGSLHDAGRRCPGTAGSLIFTVNFDR